MAVVAGANMIPMDIFHSRPTAADVQRLVAAAVSANMNMLRIWGGGRYQIDALYDAADSSGILIWQEAMFACAQYPRDDTFLQNVRLSNSTPFTVTGLHENERGGGYGLAVSASL